MIEDDAIPTSVHYYDSIGSIELSLLRGNMFIILTQSAVSDTFLGSIVDLYIWNGFATK